MRIIPHLSVIVLLLFSRPAGAEPTSPRLSHSGDLRLAEGEEGSVVFSTSGFGESRARIRVSGAPSGAYWLAGENRLVWKPDFIQGPGRWTVTAVAESGHATQSATVSIELADSIRPPWPQIFSTRWAPDRIVIDLRQGTDDYLDSPENAGRSFVARIVVPASATASHRLPVRVLLHGFNGRALEDGPSDVFSIYPSDPENSYWWGYSKELPRFPAEQGSVPNYTQRRVLHLLEWVLRYFPGADPERVALVGGSMGGAGAASLGLMSGRHFCEVRANIGQLIPRNHRPERLAQLSALWGTPERGLRGTDAFSVWDEMDLTRVVRESDEARNQYLFMKHGKDDPIIHFGAVVWPSPLTKVSFYDVLQIYRVGHYVVWDEGGHGTPDPVLAWTWWDQDFDPLLDPVTFVRRNLAFPAFTYSQADEFPGHGRSRDERPLDANAAYAGAVETAGDTGWDGDLAGARNRFLRWDARKIVDTKDRFSVPLFHVDGPGGSPPAQGYPSTGDSLGLVQSPIRVDVTPRRLQVFSAAPKERLHWRFGDRKGSVVAGPNGGLTIEGLPVSRRPTRLEIYR